jgi:uncharacterized membrane protein YbhN (UPF0104 family)
VRANHIRLAGLLVGRAAGAPADVHLMTLNSAIRKNPAAVTIVGTLAVCGAVGFALADKRGEFVAALSHTPLWIVGVAVVLHLGFLLARSEAWNVCVGAAGGRVGRGRLFQAASIGYLGNLFNGQVGMVMRVAALRRTEPDASPKASVLLASEFPIVVVEGALAALMSFTLVGPLGIPWWSPLVAFAVIATATVFGSRFARERPGFWRGFAVFDGLRGRGRIIGLVAFAGALQILRTWFLLRATGADASVLDSIALLIGIAVVGVFPVGPSAGVAAAVLILGSHGMGPAAATGALLTVTSAVACLTFASWALALWARDVGSRRFALAA